MIKILEAVLGGFEDFDLVLAGMLVFEQALETEDSFFLLLFLPSLSILLQSVCFDQEVYPVYRGILYLLSLSFQHFFQQKTWLKFQINSIILKSDHLGNQI